MRTFIYFLFPLYLLAIEPITPIPQTIKYNKAKVLLGKKLFFDKTISANGDISCASCHSPKYGGADPSVVSIGVYGKHGNIQSPTVYNSGYNFRQFWNGRARDLEEQINGPTHNPVEMGMNTKKILIILNKKYKGQFYKVYKKWNITFAMFQDAIASFERTLITPNCKFDKWLRGEVKLTKIEKDGYYNFKKLGCITCHNGINIGGNSFQKIGVIHTARDRDGDRFEVTHKEIDKFVYKVPTLRNVALTAPYFHNGITYKLDDAIQFMAYYNLGLDLTSYQTESIKVFLETLTGDKPKTLDLK